MEVLDKRNIKTKVRKIIRSYFTNRKLILECGSEREDMPTSAGVPQESVLGPTLWNLLYDDLLRLCEEEGIELIAYADAPLKK